MRSTRFQLLVGIVLITAVTLVALAGVRAIRQSTAELRERDEAARDIASGVAAALDRGRVSELRDTVQTLMLSHPGVRAVQVAPIAGKPLLTLGPASVEAALAARDPNARDVALVRAGRRWGSVRIAFVPGSQPSAFNPESPLAWVIVGGAVLVLPFGAALLEALRRRMDRSAGGPMAVAADRARATLNTLAEGVMLLDDQRRIAFANEAFCRVAGVPGPALRGRSVADLPWVAPAGGTLPAPLPWEAVVESKQPSSGARIGIQTGDAQALFTVNSTPLFWGRKLHGVLVTLDDVTELELSRASLQQARDAAETASETKGRFLAMMSHEIRTPLNGVCGSLQLLGKTELGQDQSRYVGAARFSASTLLHLINDILDFSKIEAGQLELNPVPFDLERCLDDTMLMMVQPARARGLDLAYEIDPAVGEWFLADPDRIRQVAINLVNNAIKFTEHGSVTVRVLVERDGAARQMVRLEVADTGIGIPADKMDRLFKAFSQVDSSTHRRHGGTGLGLIISKQLCELMGGRIEVSSVEGEGTTFTFFLDLERCAPPEDEPAPPRINATWAVLVGLHELERRTVGRALALPPERILWGSEAELRQRIGAIPPGSTGVVAVVAGSNAAETEDAAARTREILPGAGLRVLGAAYAEDYPSGGTNIDEWVSRPLGRRRVRAAADHSSIAKPAPAQAAASAPDLSGLKILLAEDNPVGQMVVTEMLRGAGIHCDAVGTGLEAVAAIEREPYDLVLMDCFMPELDGFEATGRVRALQKQGRVRAGLPVIALTAKAMRGDREACLKAGMDGYVTKPVDQDELFRTIAQFSGRGKEMPMTTAPPPSDGAEARAFRERYGDKSQLLPRLVEAFQSTATQDLTRIEEALRASDAHALEHAAHRLAGGAGFVCAERVRRLAKDLETRSAASQLEGLEAIARQLREELEGSIRDLQQFVSPKDPGRAPRPVTPEVKS